MASHSFVLKEPTSKEETLIYFIIRDKGKRLKLSTGIKIQPSKWDSEKQRVNRKATIGEQAGNSKLRRLIEAFDSYTAKHRIEGLQFSLKDFKAYLENLNKPQQEKSNSLITFIDSFVAEVVRREETIKGYKNTRNRLKDFQDFLKEEITFADVDLSLLNSLVRFFEEKKNFSMNTIHLHVKNLKVFMKEAEERGLHSNKAHESKKFSVKTENTPKVYLTNDEIDQIRSLDLSNDKRLDRIKDLLLIQLNTGVRVSDLHKINEDNLIIDEEGNHFFQIRTEKTSEFIIIPVLNNETLDLLKKYKGASPSLQNNGKPLSDQKYNEYIKEVALKAEILETFTSYQTIGGKRVEKTDYKANLITSHTARRSFATNAYKAELPTLSIMKITGHRTERSFMRYIQLSAKEHALQLIKRNKKPIQSNLSAV